MYNSTIDFEKKCIVDQKSLFQESIYISIYCRIYFYGLENIIDNETVYIIDRRNEPYFAWFAKYLKNLFKL